MTRRNKIIMIMMLIIIGWMYYDTLTFNDPINASDDIHTLID